MARRRILLIVLIGIAVLLTPLVLVGALVLVVQSEWGERWLERTAGDRIHREVQVDGIKVHFEWPPVLSFARVRIGNPPWAKTPDVLDAEGLTARIEILPLLERRLVVPYLHARTAKAGLEQSAERATWRFDQDQRQPGRIELERVFLEDGHIVYRHEDEDTALDVKVKGSLGEKGELKLDATGKFRGEPSKGTATLPSLDLATQDTIRIVGKGNVGNTRLTGDGEFATDFKTLDMQLRLAGQTLKELHKLFGMVLPETPPYNVAGHLRHSGKEWNFDPLDGKVGDSDLKGNVTYLTGGERPFFRATLRSKRLDFDDLGPLVGAPPKTGPGETASAKQQADAAQLAASSRILPSGKFGSERWKDMDADVHLVADKVMRPARLPIDTLSTHLILKDAVVRLQPLTFGVAGGRVSADVALDGRAKPMRGDMKVEVQGLHLARLFPTIKVMDEALGTMYGRAELKGHGASVGDLLGTSNGNVVLAASGGRVSDLLVQLLEIDVARAAMLLGSRDQQVDLRCAVGNFSVKDGVASSESFVVDTAHTFVRVEGRIDMAQERFDLVIRARGKTPSIFVLRTPVVMEGPLKRPSIHPKAGPIAAQTGVAAALGAVNPLLAIIPFLDPGSGKDADCDKLLADARSKGAVEKTKTAKAD